MNPILKCSHLFLPPEPMPLVGKWPRREYCTRCRQWTDTSVPQNPILKAYLEGLEELDINQRLFLAGKLHSTEFNKWFCKVTVNLLKAAKEAGPEQHKVVCETHDENIIQEYGACGDCDCVKANKLGYKDCLSSFTSAVDEGIKGIEKGEV